MTCDYREELRLGMEDMEDAARVGPTMLPPDSNSKLAYTQAVQQYRDYVVKEADHLFRLYGFSYEATDDAPDNYAAVVEEFRDCCETSRPFRVWSGGSETSVFQSPGINHAFRFIHDVRHVTGGHPFTHEGEAELIRAYVDHVFTRKGYLCALLAAADTLGQLWYGTNNHGAFVEDQEPFVSSIFYCLLRQHQERLRRAA